MMDEGYETFVDHCNVKKGNKHWLEMEGQIFCSELLCKCEDCDDEGCDLMWDYLGRMQEGMI